MKRERDPRERKQLSCLFNAHLSGNRGDYSPKSFLVD